MQQTNLYYLWELKLCNSSIRVPHQDRNAHVLVDFAKIQTANTSEIYSKFIETEFSSILSMIKEQSSVFCHKMTILLRNY